MRACTRSNWRRTPARPRILAPARGPIAWMRWKTGVVPMGSVEVGVKPRALDLRPGHSSRTPDRTMRAVTESWPT